MTETTLVWLRRDLRLRDNPALHAAAQRGAVLPVYVLDDINGREFQTGQASRWWLHQSLEQLNAALDDGLVLLRGDPLEQLCALLRESDIRRVMWNRCYEPWETARDRRIRAHLEELGIEVQSFNGHLLWEPWQIHKADKTPYRVFTPYYRRGCLAAAEPRLPLPLPETLQLTPPPVPGLALDALELMPARDWVDGLSLRWQPGESGAGDRLSAFLGDALARYADERNIPGLDGTSGLSPHLHCGEISPNQAWYAARHAGGIDEKQLDCFLSELGWREFAHYLLFHFPELPEQNFQRGFDAFSWQQDPLALAAWQRGRTGIPMVDAGMRELWQTGFMHNRVRMVVGSFLVKNLLIDWREGERWFRDCLVDADLAANSASWQWVAGSGADAAPYFRIFNPVTQGKRFDPDGAYVRRYCPELAELPDKYLHSPWEAPAQVLEEAGVILGDNYPQPVVDLKLSRQRALDAYAGMRRSTMETPLT